MAVSLMGLWEALLRWEQAKEFCVRAPNVDVLRKAGDELAGEVRAQRAEVERLRGELLGSHRLLGRVLDAAGGSVVVSSKQVLMEPLLDRDIECRAVEGGDGLEYSVSLPR